MTKSTIALLKALGNDRRLEVLSWLADPTPHFPPQTDGDLVEDGVCLVFLAQKMGISQPSASKHLEILRNAGLVEAKPIGRWTFYRRNEEAIRSATAEIADALIDPTTEGN